MLMKEKVARKNNRALIESLLACIRDRKQSLDLYSNSMLVLRVKIPIRENPML